MILTLKAANGCYVQRVGDNLHADLSDGSALAAKIIVEPRSDGTFALKQGASYWSAQPDGRLQCNRSSGDGEWEAFRQVPGQRAGSIAWQSAKFNTYVTAPPSGPLYCSVTVLNDWESFDVPSVPAPTRPMGSERGGLDLGPRYFLNNGQPWPFVGYHAHCLEVLHAQGGDVDAFLDFPIDATFNTIILIGTHLSAWEVDHGYRLDPREAGHYDRLHALVRRITARQTRVLYYAFGPGSERLTAAERRAHFQQSCDVFRGNPLAFHGKGNESNVNGWREEDFTYTDMGGVRVTQGTAGGNVNPTAPYLDFVVYETRQDVPTVIYDNGSGMRQMMDGDFAGPATQNRTLLSGEWGICNDVTPDQFGDHRFTDPSIVLEIARANGAFCGGGAAGCTASLIGEIPNAATQAILRQYPRGVRAAFVR